MHLSEFPHLFLLLERLDVDIHLVKIFALSLSPSDDDGALFFCNLSIFNCIMDEKFQSFREHSIRTLFANYLNNLHSRHRRHSRHLRRCCVHEKSLQFLHIACEIPVGHALLNSMLIEASESPPEDPENC